MTTREQKQRLYGSRWRRLRLHYLAEHPLCVMCTADGRIKPATELDHIIKHDGDPALFWDVNNLQGLCRDHHGSTKAKYEASGKMVGCDASGNPLHPHRAW